MKVIGRSNTGLGIVKNENWDIMKQPIFLMDIQSGTLLSLTNFIFHTFSFWGLLKFFMLTYKVNCMLIGNNNKIFGTWVDLILLTPGFTDKA